LGYIDSMTTKDLDFLKKAHDQCLDLSEKLIFNNHDTRHVLIISIYGSILELIASIVVLADKKLVTGIPILLRSLLEAYVDFHNLCKDPNYRYFVEYEFVITKQFIIDYVEILIVILGRYYLDI